MKRRSEDAGPARALRALVFGGGVVATVAGLHTVLAGARSLPGQEAANASLESELRYYAAFYVAYGLCAASSALRADRNPAVVRALAGTLLGAGLARAGGWVAVGPPHPLQRGLLAIELAAPPLIVGISARSAGRRRGR
jgi:Domain of unknown function (DUF4345)